MANELPYFRFHVSAWQNGKIDIESYELKGLFISICGYYWMQDCSITLAMLQKKFSNARPELIKNLIDLGIIKHESRHDKVEIEFLNIQYDLLSEKRKHRQDAGSKGGNAKAMLKQKSSYKDKDKDNIILDKDKIAFSLQKDLESQEGFSKEMKLAFLNYWSEKNSKGKERWQLEKTWETRKRLITWAARSNQFTKKTEVKNNVPAHGTKYDDL